MAKGENLEKPSKKKKTGMVIVIGMGAKPPKDSMKKAERRGRGSAGAKRAKSSKFFDKLKRGTLNIDEIAERRRIDPENLHGEIQRRHNMSFEDYLNSERPPFNMQELLNDLAEGAASKRTDERKQQRILDGLLNTEKFKNRLNAAGITPMEWHKAVRREEESGKLTEDTFNELFEELKEKKGRAFERKPRSSKMDRAAKREYDRFFDALDEEKPKERPDEELPESEEEKLERLQRLFQARGESPNEASMQALRFMTTGSPYERVTNEGYSGRNPKIHYAASDFNMAPYAGTGEFSPPRATQIAPAGSVESELSGFRGAKPIQFLPRNERNRTDDEETDPLDIAGQTESLMQRKSEPMIIAWDILKGGMKTVDLIAQENRGNMEGAMQSMQESFPNLPREEAMKLIINAMNARSRDAMQESQMRNFPKLDDMEDPNERAMLPNQDNLAHQSGNLPE